MCHAAHPSLPPGPRYVSQRQHTTTLASWTVFADSSGRRRTRRIFLVRSASVAAQALLELVEGDLMLRPYPLAKTRRKHEASSLSEASLTTLGLLVVVKKPEKTNASNRIFRRSFGSMQTGSNRAIQGISLYEVAERPFGHRNVDPDSSAPWLAQSWRKSHANVTQVSASYCTTPTAKSYASYYQCASANRLALERGQIPGP